jgi:phosphatidylglycerophosphatase C
MSHETKDCAVFDLDHTLLSSDSTAVWMRGLLQASPLKLLAALFVLLPALVLVKAPSTRRIGASALLWIATLGLDGVALKRNIDAFVTSFEHGSLAMHWFADGIGKVREHVALGHRIVVVTAAPQWLAERLLTSFGGDVQVIGSSLRRVGGGWIVDRHCRGREKCRMLLEAGYGDSWRWAYSDSDEDAPMLARAQEAFLINASVKVQKQAAAQGVSDAMVLQWN